MTNTNNEGNNAPIVIIGGGAGGLELATKLGRYYKKKTAACGSS
ncbi:hypothetical protein ACPUVO_12945 [Pseudocolwellia sp. HL-MZ19]